MISKHDALTIAAKHVGIDCRTDFNIYSEEPANCNIYRTWNDKEPSWFVFVPWNDNKLVLRSSRVIVISQKSGEVLFDGNAGDEG